MNMECTELVLIKSNLIFFSRLSEGGEQFFINIHCLGSHAENNFGRSVPVRFWTIGTSK